jgi:hypothetical protein
MCHVVNGIRFLKHEFAHSFLTKQRLKEDFSMKKKNIWLVVVTVGGAILIACIACVGIDLIGKTRDNPVPAGTSVNIDGKMTLTVVSAIRPADSIVSNASDYNNKPEPNQEYVQVTIQVVCNKPSSETCYFDIFSIRAVGADGNIHDVEIFIGGIDGLLESVEFFGSSTREGKIFLFVPKDDSSVVLFYDPYFGNNIYLGLP